MRLAARGVIWVAGLVGLMAGGPAIAAVQKPAPKPIHTVIRKTVVRRVIQRVVHPVVRRVAYHPAISHPPIRHPVLRQVVHTVAHPVVHAVIHPPVRHDVARRVVRPVVRKMAYHPMRNNWGGVSCVPFAKAASGIALMGNAGWWWDAASGRYARGHRPEPGSVLAFRPIARMPLGHVAVVTRIVGRREILVDQANWGLPGRITRGVRVVDVSPRNDWSDVKVAMPSGVLGTPYPTFGFIYNRPDHGGLAQTEVADAPATAHARVIDAPPRTLR